MRTTLFFKGCSLQCAWCHNPETIAFHQQLMWRERLCIACKECLKNSNSHLSLGDYIKDALKNNKIEAASYCPAKAFRLAAKEYTVDMIVKEISKYADLNKSMGGGVTFSGGEPMTHSAFIEDVIDELADKNIHFAIDTCAEVSFDKYIRLLPKINLLLFDIKESDAQKHKLFTGRENTLIIDNLIKIIDFIKTNNLSCKLWIRTPLIPKMTSSEENIRGIWTPKEISPEY